MATNDKKRQQKLAKKRAKTKKRLGEIAKRKQVLTSAKGKMMAASSGEIVGCFISEDSNFSPGMRSVLLMRRGPQSLYGAAFFMLDMLCLGVKDCGHHLGGREQIFGLQQNMDDRLNMLPIDPPTARAIVEGAVDFAGDLGLPPHQDYKTGKLLWGDIPVGEIPQDIEFGRDGKPFYVPGPYDDPAKQEFIMNCLAIADDERHVEVSGNESSLHFG